jgi:hypothetical protein
MNMVNRYILRETARATIFQPPILCMIILQTALIATIVFGVRVEYEDHILCAVRFFGRELSDGETFLRLVLPTFTGFLSLTLMFLAIIGMSSLIPDMLNDPLTTLVVIRPLSRTRLFVSTFAGIVAGVVADLAAFGSILCLVLTAKCEGAPVFAPLLGSLWFAGDFLVITACCSLFAILTESTTGTAILGLALYFGLGPAMDIVRRSGNTLLAVFSYFIPRTGTLASDPQQITWNTALDPAPLVTTLLPACIYFAIAVYLFHRRDF